MDTGAQVSIIPPTSAQHKHPQEGLHLRAVNNFTITAYGNQLLTLDLGLRRSFCRFFVDVQTPILGADFLQHFGLLRHTCLSNEVTQLKVQRIFSAMLSPCPSLLSK